VIFVTVGTQLPFDRMVKTVDQWALRAGRDDVFAQIGPSEYKPRHIQWAHFIDADECRQRVEECTAVIAHAGMGSVITALELGKPIIVMPRDAKLNEHRNDHQLATARHLLRQGHVIVAFDEGHLEAKLEQIDSLRALGSITSAASNRLVHALRDFIEGSSIARPVAIDVDRYTPASPGFLGCEASPSEVMGVHAGVR
jgi:UDP-N-acetylglucosamine transferase subunit ALG13